MSIIITFGWRGFGYDGPPIREIRIGVVSVAWCKRSFMVEIGELKMSVERLVRS